MLPGLRGTHPYNPGRVLRQFEIKQETPQIDSMLRFFTEYDESKPSLKDYMINGWRRKKWVEVSFRIGYEPEVSDTYKEWLKKSLAGALNPGPNVPTRVVDVESEHQIRLHRLQDEFQKSEIAHRQMHMEDALTIHTLREELKRARQDADDARQCLIDLDDSMASQLDSIGEMTYDCKAQLCGSHLIINRYQIAHEVNKAKKAKADEEASSS